MNTENMPWQVAVVIWALAILWAVVHIIRNRKTIRKYF